MQFSEPYIAVCPGHFCTKNIPVSRPFHTTRLGRRHGLFRLGLNRQDRRCSLLNVLNGFLSKRHEHRLGNHRRLRYSVGHSLIHAGQQGSAFKGPGMRRQEVINLPRLRIQLLDQEQPLHHGTFGGLSILNSHHVLQGSAVQLGKPSDALTDHPAQQKRQVTHLGDQRLQPRTLPALNGIDMKRPDEILGRSQQAAMCFVGQP